MVRLKVDGSSGQVYTEIVSTPVIALANGPAWVHESPFLPSGWEEGSPVGASPLMHIAMRKLLSDQRNLAPALFTEVPWSIAEYLWDALGRCKRQTLHMWKLLAAVYPTEFSGVENYRSMKIEGPKLSMREYLGLVKSDSLSWRVVLTLAASYARVPELVGVSEIRNLFALDIATPAKPGSVPEDTDLQVTALTDRIVRAWSELAQTAGAFSHLRVLILRHQTELSRVALHYLRAFPNLQTIVAYGCPGILSACRGSSEVEGWAVVDQKRLPLVNLYTFYEDNFKTPGGEDLAFAKTPVLDFQIGEKQRDSRAHSEFAVKLQRTEITTMATGRDLNRKRKDVGVLADQQSQRRKAVMKSRTKDIGDVLKDFF
ncbi:hypothetical protein BJY04DRAFT_218243 [Aspergillus karnatakaensis]|uniref:uncharacterized protein n=1 Tax=Aspergillus karnatakaensis TaxID=1810916 RepID=UPI003CCE2A5E